MTLKNILKVAASLSLLQTVGAAETTSDIVKNELALKQQYQKEANIAFASGLKLQVAKDYEGAIKAYQSGRSKVLLLSESDSSLLVKVQQVDKQIAQIKFSWAKELLLSAESKKDLSALEKSELQLNEALTINPLLKDQISFVQSNLDSIRQKLRYTIGVDVEAILKATDDKNREISALLEQAQILFNHKRYYDAREALSKVIVKDPFNMDAVDLLEKLNAQVLEAGLQRRALSTEALSNEVVWKWQESLSGVVTQDDVVDDRGLIPSEENEDGTASKLKSIVFPTLKLSNATIEDALETIKRLAKKYDADGEGISFVYNKSQAPVAEAPVVEDEEGEDEEGEDVEGEEPVEELALETPTGEVQHLITMEVDEVALGDIIRYITEAAGLQYKIEDFAVVISEPGAEIATETKVYPVAAAFGDTIDAAGKKNAKDLLIALGIKFPGNSGADYLKASSRLVVNNTAENLLRIEKTLNELNIQPTQVSIEAKFVEINQTDLEEIGFDWILNESAGSNTFGARGQSVVDNAGARGTTFGARSNAGLGALSSDSTSLLTYGLRTFSDTTGAALFPQTLGLTTVLGGLEFGTFIKAIERKDSTDVLSAPKVTAKSGNTAKVRVVEERYLATSYDAPTVQFNRGRVNIEPPLPVFEEPRDLGVSLEVTPTVDPDGYTINLELKPEVIDLIGFDREFNELVNVIEVVQTGRDIDGDGTPDAFIPESLTNTFEFAYPTPIIEARTIETNVRVWDGETVSIGGLMKEREESFKSKVPFLGDIPYLGRLFRSEGTNSEKRNLLIFVTARLITPAGLAIRPSKLSGLPDFKR